MVSSEIRTYPKTLRGNQGLNKCSILFGGVSWTILTKKHLLFLFLFIGSLRVTHNVFWLYSPFSSSFPPNHYLANMVLTLKICQDPFVLPKYFFSTVGDIYSYLYLYVRILSGLGLHRSCACCYNYWEFICAIALILFPYSHPPLLSLIHPLFHNDPWVFERMRWGRDI